MEFLLYTVGFPDAAQWLASEFQTYVVALLAELLLLVELVLNQVLLAIPIGTLLLSVGVLAGHQLLLSIDFAIVVASAGSALISHDFNLLIRFLNFLL